MTYSYRREFEMDRREQTSLSTRVSARLCTTCLASLLALAGPSYAEDSGTQQPDGRAFPLTRDDVMDLEAVLTQLGYYTGEIDGVVGPEIVAAVKRLARSIELEFVRHPSGRETVLTCEIMEGTDRRTSTEIMLDEYRRIAIYDFQFPARRNYNPIHESNGTSYDASMKISEDSAELIVANNDTSTLIITKENGYFSYSSVMMAPGTTDKLVAVLGTSHWGRCVKGAFD